MNTSETVAIEAGTNAISGTFSGIANFMQQAPLFAILMAIAVVGVGVALFRKILGKFSRKS